jgi:hypothetical protein
VAPSKIKFDFGLTAATPTATMASLNGVSVCDEGDFLLCYVCFKICYMMLSSSNTNSNDDKIVCVCVFV